MKRLISFVDMLNRFEVMHFQLTAVLENWGFPRQFLGVWEKKLKVGDQPWHPMLCANFVAIRWGTAEIHYLERQGLNEEMKVLLQNI